MSETVIQMSATLENAGGLHARPAVKLSKAAKTFSADVALSLNGGDKWVNAKSTSAVMKMKAGIGTELKVKASGDDAEAAVSAILELIREKFGE